MSVHFVTVTPHTVIIIFFCLTLCMCVLLGSFLVDGTWERVIWQLISQSVYPILPPRMHQNSSDPLH